VQLGPPVRQRQAQALQIGMVGENLRFDVRDLLAAALDVPIHRIR